MIYVQQQPQQTVRSRKRPLVPLNMDNEIKIEFVNFDGMEELQFADSASNDSLSTSTTGDYIEVVTATAEEDDDDGVSVTTDDHDQSDHDNSNNGATPVHRPRKRAKLDHLSVEQKAQHRKMMNRISAQSARDRQRALMQQQEQNITTLTGKYSMLQQENTKLKATNEKLVEECRKIDLMKQENAKLKNLVAELENKLKVAEFQSTEVNHLEKRTAASVCSTLEPAVLDTCPLLKGQSLQQTSSAYLILMSAFFLWISTPQKFSELLRTFQHKSSDKTQNLASISHLLPKHLIHQLQHLQTQIKMQQMEQMEQTKLKPPD